MTPSPHLVLPVAQRQTPRVDSGMWEPFLLLALLVAAWRRLRRRPTRSVLGPLPAVGDAPANAEPIIHPRLDDNGLATYSMVFPGTQDQSRARGKHEDVAQHSRGVGTSAP